MRVSSLKEEIIGSAEFANNGAGPMWCFASPSIVRHNEYVFATLPETSLKVKPLNNIRWRLYMRDSEGNWDIVANNDIFNEREPHPVVIQGSGRILVSTNPSGEVLYWDKETDRDYRHAEPVLLQFNAGDPRSVPVPSRPVWSKQHKFTDHSYRGIAADSANGEVLYFNIEGYEGYGWSLLNNSGVWEKSGTLVFPERGCYPAVALKDGAAYVLAVRDIVEPNEQWRTFKKEVTGRSWDYLFDVLYLTYTPDIRKEAFSTPLIVEDSSETAGTAMHRDMLIDDNNNIHLLYKKQNIHYRHMRDRFFPGTSIISSLIHAIIREGRVVERNVIYETVEPSDHFNTGAILHRDTDGSLYAVYYADEANWLHRLKPASAPVKLDLKHPLSMFFSASERTGTPCSNIIDLYGSNGQDQIYRYVQIELNAGCQTQSGQQVSSV